RTMNRPNLATLDGPCATANNKSARADDLENPDPATDSCMSDTATCPYCNTALPAPGSRCPRCDPDPSAVETPRWANRRGALAVVGLMLTLFVSVMIYAIRTRTNRGLVPLAELPTLGYLPADVNVIAGSSFAQARQTPTGRDLLAPV